MNIDVDKSVVASYKMDVNVHLPKMVQEANNRRHACVCFTELEKYHPCAKSHF